MRARQKESRKPFFGIGIGAVLLVAAFLIPNGASVVQGQSIQDCQDKDIRKCAENESCVGIWIFKQCTKHYFYMPRSSDGDDGELVGPPAPS